MVSQNETWVAGCPWIGRRRSPLLVPSPHGGLVIERFGPAHLAALGVVGAISMLVALAARMADERTRAWLGRALALGLAAYVFFTYREMWRDRPPLLSWDLPLHLCNVVLGCCLAVCLTRSPAGFELSWFWGLAGTAQAMITPDIDDAFPSWWFFQFFIGHGLVIVAIAYGAGCGLRCRPGGVRRAFVWLNVYAAVVGALDYAFRWNYGYLCRPPREASLFDYLGPWPWYIAGLEVIAIVSFMILDLPWRAGRES